ncbi:4'-phosphopantetheinyl transferase family protein [Gynurincola endophyticus]|uniref:4'-phosphopantetheinyl transferase family protein n=1 Tax=Gynurincola endophyticus TaxID=2479004 RepID=UPI000F8E82C3|nr:4'-phosphopantetheinyl transferase superfamily protein [Gynurincola endophyticus]
MALFFEQNIKNGGKLGIWKIEEPESFFSERVPLYQDISHPYKRLQHLAGRYLLRHLVEHFPVQDIKIADTKKPYLQNDAYHFSISHCGNFAAAIINDNMPVGIDIEIVTPRIQRIGNKFLHEREVDYLSDFVELPQLHLELITVIWSAKEAVFKWYGKGKVDFKNHITLCKPIVIGTNEEIDMYFMFSREHTPYEIRIKARLFKHLVLAYIVH